MQGGEGVAQLPKLSHLTSKDYANVYEPAEDTYLFLDALLKDLPALRKLQPSICLEVGSGSGCVTCYLAGLLQQPWPTFFLTTDINEHATVATQRTAAANKVSVDTVRTDLVRNLKEHLQGKVDVLLFNPPYVPTDPEEVGTHSIAAAWAGGIDGRQVLDRLLPSIPELLSEKGVFYLVVVEENKPEDIKQILGGYGFSCQKLAERRAFNEQLAILKFYRDEKTEEQDKENSNQ
jgi:release factor glutamine methyltransferase